MTVFRLSHPGVLFHLCYRQQFVVKFVLSKEHHIGIARQRLDDGFVVVSVPK